MTVNITKDFFSTLDYTASSRIENFVDALAVLYLKGIVPVEATPMHWAPILTS